VRQLGVWLEALAVEVTAARMVLGDRRARAQSGDTGGNDDGVRVHTSRISSTTETRALAAVHNDEQHDTMLEHVNTIRQAIRQARRYIHANIMRGPDLPAEPDGPTLCKDGQHGKEGAIEWGDTTCEFPASKSGLCSAHYLAWYRYRKASGIDTTKDFAA
jgi:hypothetical protein